jgi:hypothetical protein
MLFAVAGLKIAPHNFGPLTPYQAIAISLSDQVFLVIDTPEQHIAAYACEENRQC